MWDDYSFQIRFSLHLPNDLIKQCIFENTETKRNVSNNQSILEPSIKNKKFKLVFCLLRNTQENTTSNFWNLGFS